MRATGRPRREARSTQATTCGLDSASSPVKSTGPAAASMACATSSSLPRGRRAARGMAAIPQNTQARSHTEGRSMITVGALDAGARGSSRSAGMAAA